jgi:CRP-like cAMP-binding protein
MSPIQILINEMNNQNLWEKDIDLERNAYLKVSGSMDTNLYFIQKGSLRIYVLDDNEEHTIRFGYRNNLITALDSFLSEKPSELYIQALKKSTVKAMSKATLLSFIESTPETKSLWSKILEAFILQQMERERDILTFSPVERYQRVLKRSPQLFQEIPNKYIASYLRMSPETLSRLKKS